jgi:hypothetical protein
VSVVVVVEDAAFVSLAEVPLAPMALVPPVLPEPLFDAVLSVLEGVLPAVEPEDIVLPVEPEAPVAPIAPLLSAGVPVAPIGVFCVLRWPAPTAGSLGAVVGGLPWASAEPANATAATAASRPLIEVFAFMGFSLDESVDVRPRLKAEGNRIVGSGRSCLSDDGSRHSAPGTIDAGSRRALAARPTRTRGQGKASFPRRRESRAPCERGRKALDPRLRGNNG